MPCEPLSRQPCSGIRPVGEEGKERNTQVSAALNGIVKIIIVQNFSVFFVKKIIRMKFHSIAGKFASLWCGFVFTGFS